MALAAEQEKRQSNQGVAPGQKQQFHELCDPPVAVIYFDVCIVPPAEWLGNISNCFAEGSITYISISAALHESR